MSPQSNPAELIGTSLTFYNGEAFNQKLCQAASGLKGSQRNG